ncbi:alpha amylase C-terminal domain-containing protein [bacterium]|nr:alpha amylase C-terminal domain-containing protein [bacterium]
MTREVSRKYLQLLGAAWLCLALVPGVAHAQGTATLSPQFPARGSSPTIVFDATGGPLASESPVVATVGFNGFQNAADVTLSGSPPNWTGSFSVPNDATSIDIVFKNSGGSIFDNNGGNGVDWQFQVDSVQSVEPGAMKVSSAEGDGYLFRVWAPDVASMAVVGEFNSWVSNADLMTSDSASGIWTAHVPGATTGQEYKYLMDGTEYRRDPRGRFVQGASDNSVTVDPSTYTFTEPRPGTTAAFHDWVVYELHIGTLDPFAGVAPGTFADLIPNRLNYIQEMNFNAIHVMPINDFAGTTSGGYNPTELFAIERDYGTPDDFRNFVEACHARGIAVIVDVVHNHYGPGGLDIYDFQDLNGNASRDEPGIYFYDSPLELAETAYGPRPDYSETEVRNFIEDSIAMFLDEYNVDGFRWDFTKAMRATLDGSFNIQSTIPEGVSLLQDINANMLATNPDLISIAEDHAGDPLLTTSVSTVSGDPADGFGFDTQWTTNFHYQVVGELIKTADVDFDMNTIATAVNGDFGRLHYLESHDEVWETNSKDRVPTRIDPATPESLRSRKMSALGAGLLLTTEGMPMIFQGSEILDIGGTDGDNSWEDDDPIDWSRLIDPNIAGFRLLYRDLIALRRNLGNETAGLLGDVTNIYLTENTNKVIAFTRSNGGSNPGDTVVVMANFSSVNYTGGYNVGLPDSGDWYEVFNSDDSTYGTDFGDVGVGQTVTTSAVALDGFPQSGSVTIGARSLVILSQVPPWAGVEEWREQTH